jgi:Tol biopolymer transport system component
MPMSRLRGGAAAIAVLAGSLLIPAPAAATPSGEPGLIAIGCEDGLWTVDAEGSGLVQVTDEPVLTPDWSPAGTMIAFTRLDAPGIASLWVMDADGSDERRLTNPTAEARDPSWTPSAEFIGYSTNEDGDRTIRAFSMGTGYSSAVVYPEGVSVQDPAFAPVPSADWWYTLVVASVDGGPTGIWVNQHVAYQVVQTTAPPAGSTDASPDWAPSGDRYAFVRDDGSTRSIQAVDLDGSDLVRLTDETVDAISPTYSADGSTIAFLARPATEYGTEAAFDLWTMNADGSGAEAILSDVACEHIDWQSVLDPPLADGHGSFAAAIAWAYDNGIATGCRPERFCTTRTITRGQVATFLARALDLPDATEDYFADDDGTTHEDDINRLAEAGLTTGCGDGTYCPQFLLKRGQIASFIARALELPEATADYFDDDDGATHEADINRMAEAGLTTGCGPSRFCPTRGVTRGEAMAFVYRAVAP